jgi:gluconokinase
MKNSVVLALDMGTSSVRAMLFDVRGKALPDMEVQLPYAQRMTADGGVEMDAEVLLTRTVDCVKQLLRKTEKSVRARLAGVGVSCFWHSLVGVGEDGQATTPVYSWADTRSQSQATELRKKLDEARYHAKTGCVLHTSYWPAKLCWLSETNPDVMARTQHWMSFGEYINLRLFGQTECSISMASGTGLFDQNAGDWAETVLTDLPITAKQLNPLTDRQQAQQGLVREFATALAPVKDLPWFPALGDGACSNIGSGASARNRIAINMGTSGAIRVVVEADHVTIPPGLFCYRVDRKRFLLGGAFAGGGNIYAWQHNALQLDPRPIAARRLGTMAPDSHGLTVLPFWAGERSPGWHVGARATITGMNLHTTPLEILRASLEAVAYTFADVLDRLHQAYPGEQEIVASGGAILHSPVWAQIMADVFGSAVTTSEVAEASSRGAAILALDSLGLINSLSDVPLYLGKSYKPVPERTAVYQKARTRYQALYDTLLGGKTSK